MMAEWLRCRTLQPYRLRANSERGRIVKNCILLVSVSLLAICSLCFGQSTSNQSAKTRIKAMTQSSLDEVLIEREKAVWESLKNKQFDAFRQYYANDFRSFSAVGFHDVKQ